MAQLQLYKKFSKRKNSTKQPGSADYTRDVYMKVPVSMQNPVFILNTVDLDVNYCKFEDHYYFVDDIQLSLNGQYELHCSMDELASHKTEIGETTAIISRSQLTNVTMSDGMINPTLSIIQRQTKTTTIQWIDKTDGCFAVKFSSSAHQSPYLMTPSQFSLYLGAIGLYSSLADLYKFIVSVTWFPISIDLIKQSNTKYDVQVGLINMTSALAAQGLSPGQCYLATRTISYTGNTFNTPDSFYNDWRDYDPRFSSYNIRLFATNVNIPAEYLAPLSLLTWNISIDIWTGQSIIDVLSNNVLITSFTKNVGIPIQYTASTANVGGIMQAVAGGAVSVASAAIEFGAVGAVASGIASAAGIANQAINQTSNVTGSSGSFADVKFYDTVYATVIRKSSTITDKTIVGEPLNDVRKINTLTGYIQCVNASVNIASFGVDKDTINSMLNSGFYYE